MVNPSAAGQAVAVAQPSPGSAAATLLLPQGPSAGTRRMYEDSWVTPGVPVGWSSHRHQAAPDEAQGSALLLPSHYRWPCHLGGPPAMSKGARHPPGHPRASRVRAPTGAGASWRRSKVTPKGRVGAHR